MKGTIVFCLTAALLLTTAHRVPAPISEESPRPVPEQSAKPKQNRAVRPKSTSQNSESSSKQQTPAPPPKSQATPTQPRFAGTWNGIMDCGAYGIIEHTMTIDAQNSMTVWQTKNPPVRMSGPAQISGGTVVLAYSGCYWALTPDPDGKTGLAKCGCGGFLGIGAWNGSAIFHRTSP